MSTRDGVLALVYNDIRRDARVSRMSAVISEERPVRLLSVAAPGSAPPTDLPFEIHEISLDHTTGWRRTKHVVYWLAALRRGLGLRYGVVHCHDVFPLPVAALLARLRRAPLVYDAHELVDHRELRTSLFGRFWTWWHRWAIRNADRVITPTRERSEFLVERGYAPRRPPVTIMNLSDPPPADDGWPARAELGLGDGDYVVVYQGHVAEKRFTTVLVEAFALLSPDFRLVLIGDGPGSPAAADAVRRLGLEDRVELTGYLPKDRVLAYLAVGDAGVMMYDGRILNNYYCAPNKLFDYLHFRLPVIGNDLPPIRKVLVGGEVGRVVDSPPTASTLAAAIREVREREFPAHRFEAVLRDFQWSGEAERLRALYREIDAGG